MNKKIILITFIILLAACSSKFNHDYIIIEMSQNKSPLWIMNLQKYEKNKNSNNKKYKYFISEAENINKRLCEQSAIANINKLISSKISNEVIFIFNSLIEVQEDDEFMIANSKKEEIKNSVRNKLSGVEIKENYWEKRKYKAELGAKKEKLVYVCYQLARVKRKSHEKIVNEMINKHLLEIKDDSLKNIVNIENNIKD